MTRRRDHVAELSARTWQLVRARERAKHYSSRTDARMRTPRSLFQQLDDEFHFTLDAASSDANALCDRHFTEADESLWQPWAPAIVWCNPPYGRGLERWVRKAWEESCVGATVVLLVPATSDTGWFHDYALRYGEVRFIRGRVDYLRDDNPAASGRAFFPSCVVVFRPPK